MSLDLTLMNESTLRLTEIFYSLQGETRTAGLPTVFVRLTGCPLRCVYCDTAYAFTGGEVKTFTHILNEVAAFKPRFITVTGGEPLAQKNCLPLLTALCDQGYEVSLETSGAFDIKDVDARVSRVMDLKTPASGELARNLYDNIQYLNQHDQVKFVIANRDDYDWAKKMMADYQLATKVSDVLFSPVYQQINARELAEWILSDNLPVRLQMQLHKLIWGEEQGH